jgi:hypothetical protein
MNSIKDGDQARDRQSSESREPIWFGGATLGKYRHVCTFFRSADEEYKVLLLFIKEGFERGEKALHVVDPKLYEEHLLRLKSAGIDVVPAEQRGQLQVCNWHEAYLSDDRFDQHKMLAFIQEALEQGRQRGFPLTRLTARAEWTVEDWPGANDFVEYEARLNYILPRYRDTVICLYDLTKLGANYVIDVMRTHPMIIIGGILQENPFFVPPDEFLRELRERETRKVVHT